MREAVFTLALAACLTAADVPKDKPKPERVVPARKITPDGFVMENLVRGSDDRWHVRGEKQPFTGLVVDTIFRRVYETRYLKGLKHGSYTIIHPNGVIAARGIHREGKRVKHREWDIEGGQIELDAWNFDGTPRKKQ
tara:strand:+ start:487 stop:897 length:411 start_codon:yes stop_codon:yes gene_type:complete